MSDYPWAVNQEKLSRAIGQVHREQQPADKMEARIKELYVSFGGLLQKTDADFAEAKEQDRRDTEEAAVLAGKKVTEQVRRSAKKVEPKSTIEPEPVMPKDDIETLPDPTTDDLSV